MIDAQPCSEAPKPRWRVWSSWTLGIVLAIPVLVAAGFAVWMFVPRTSTRIIPTALYGGTVEGVPIVVEWPPYDHEDELPDSIANWGTFFDPAPANWDVFVLEDGQRIEIRNAMGQVLTLKRLARHRRCDRDSGFSYHSHGRTTKTTVVQPHWDDPTHWAVPLLNEAGEKPPKFFRSTWSDWKDFRTSWRTGGWSQSSRGSDRRISVVFQTPELLSVLDQLWVYVGGSHGSFEAGTNNWFRDPFSGRVEPLELSQLFREGADWQSRMIEELNDAFAPDRDRHLRNDQPKDDKRLNESHLNAPWAITPAGLRFYYSGYELGSYSGMDLLIPWVNIADLLADDGPAAALPTAFRKAHP